MKHLGVLQTKSTV